MWLTHSKASSTMATSTTKFTKIHKYSLKSPKLVWAFVCFFFFPFFLFCFVSLLLIWYFFRVFFVLLVDLSFCGEQARTHAHEPADKWNGRNWKMKIIIEKINKNGLPQSTIAAAAAIIVIQRLLKLSVWIFSPNSCLSAVVMLSFLDAGIVNTRLAWLYAARVLFVWWPHTRAHIKRPTLIPNSIHTHHCVGI